MKKKLKQSQVAKRLNVTSSTICCYEANTRFPSTDMLAQLALFYNVSADYLLGIENRSMVCVDGLTGRQADIVESLISEFRSGKNKGL
ncbi:MAG: helix-turn-helix domain-containing protein [Oscillospiraceae bacterium]|nr:helix-turn-helix domain-containing protein [Oscillospiraceae bacterium]